ncbi:MAG TPA: hypothetical protein VHO06_12550 [Polyangia bacterium]|nr:hypothetical protein [Polyangia bacterium]
MADDIKIYEHGTDYRSDDRTLHGVPDWAAAIGLSAADVQISKLTGVSGEEIAAHKRRVAAGDFKPGKRPLMSVIHLG